MNSLTRDPKGYYVALGIDEDADNDAIKSAYRSKAKRLHPDFNPSPIAAKQFNRLHEAYATLSDPAKRAAYDRPWRSEGTARPKTGANPFARGAKSADPKPDAPQQESAKAAPEPPRAQAVEQPALCKCGKVTAQPRYVVFDIVWGRLNHVQRHGIAGVFCRNCADRTAVRASLITWLAGWWAWPDGPRATVIALINNIRGGRKPPDRNARLLMRQARAFRGRGEMEIARNAAEQALAFATTPTLRREVDQLLLSLSSHPARALKNRWADPGWAPMVQGLPLALMIAAGSMAVTLAGPPSLEWWKERGAAVMRVVAMPVTAAKSALHMGDSASHEKAVGRVYAVSHDNTTMRTGPGASYQSVAVFAHGNVVLVTETDPSGQWYRVVTPEGLTGFFPADSLTADVRVDALKDVGGFAKSRAPQ